MILTSGLYLYAFLWTRPDIGEQNISKKKNQLNHLINSFKNVNFLFKYKSK